MKASLLFSGLAASCVTAKLNGSSPNVQGVCDSIHGMQCNGEDLQDIGAVNTHEQCCQACQGNSACKAWSWNWQHGKHCVLKSGCSDQKSGYSYHSGIVAPGPAPGPTPEPSPGPGPTPEPSPGPGPSPGPTAGENPLNIKPNPKRSDNFFLMIGDYGAPPGKTYGCQRKVSELMQSYVSKQQSLGKKLLFIGALGDNFYYSGLNKDRKESQFANQWKNIYGSLTDVPWLGVYGNHDHGSEDPGCACGKGCNQFNSAGRPAGAENFWIPDYYWHYLIPEIKLEVIGIDTNAVDVNGLGGNGCRGGAYETCKVCGGIGNIKNFLGNKKGEGESYMDQRARSTPATTVAILQHYPKYTGVPQAYLNRFKQNNGNKAKVLAAYGHTHDQVCENRGEGGCDLIMTGGGGGYVDNGKFLGFTAVHLTDDGGFQTVMETSETRFPRYSCRWMEYFENRTEITV